MLHKVFREDILRYTLRAFPRRFVMQGKDHWLSHDGHLIYQCYSHCGETKAVPRTPGEDGVTY